MSYAVPPAKVRPGVVTAASVLLYLLAALQLLTFGASFAQYPAFQELLADESFAQADRDLLRTAMLLGLGLALALSVAFIAGYVVLGIFLGKGKQPARVVTWVVAGLQLVCQTCSFGRQATTSGAQSGSQNLDPELRRRFDELSPDWYDTLASIRTVVEIVALVAIVILLCLSAAHDFFRKDQPADSSPGAYYPRRTQPPSEAAPVPAPESTKELRRPVPPPSQS